LRAVVLNIIYVQKGEKLMNIEIFTNCIGCGVCESINGEVFEVNAIAHVNEEFIIGNEDDCRHAAEMCPVNAIIVVENDY
jgi:ferredoxin